MKINRIAKKDAAEKVTNGNEVVSAVQENKENQATQGILMADDFQPTEENKDNKDNIISIAEKQVEKAKEDDADLQSILDGMKSQAVEKGKQNYKDNMRKIESINRETAKLNKMQKLREEKKREEYEKTFKGQVEKIRREMIVEDINKGLTAAQRHNDRKSIAPLYTLLPEDVEIETDCGFNIKVTPEISYNEVMNAIQWIFTFAADGREFISEPVLDISINLAFVKFYTNLDVSDKDLLDQFDILKRSGYLDLIIEQISDEQKDWIINAVRETAKNYVDYQNSARGMLMALSDLANDEDNGFNKMIQDFTKNADLLKQIEPIVQAYQGLSKNS